MGENTVAAPGVGAFDASQLGEVPAIAPFEVVDSSFGSGSPVDPSAEGSPVFDFAASGTKFAPAGDSHACHAERAQLAFDGCLAVAAVGGDCAWWGSGAGR